jgi:tetratricopeptide (TPR) repeat protein
MGDRQKALDIFAALSDTRIDEVGAQATLERAKALESLGSGREAVEQYLRISYVFPGFADLAAEGLFSAARLSLQQGDRENASRAEETLKKRYPDSPWANRLDELK